MMRATVRQRLHWLALHGVIRSLASFGAKRGEVQGRLIADPTVRADPGGFADELRARGRLVRGRAAWLTADHALAHQLLRSDDFAVTSIGSTLPNPLGWIESKTAVKGRLHPLLPPSLLSVEPPEHTRYRKTVSSVFTTRAVAALRERVQQAAATLIDDIGGGTVDVVDRYCSQLPVTVIGDIIGVPDDERPRILEFGELAAPSLDIGLPWEQYLRVERGLDGFNEWLANHIHRLREAPGEDLMSQLIAASEDGTRLNDAELRATAGLVLAAGFETTVNLLGSGIRILLQHPDQLARLLDEPELWPGAVEEILRLESPVQLSARLARVDTEVAGRQVQARRAGHPLPRRRQPRSRDIRRPTPFRHHPRQRGQAPVVLRWSSLLSGRRTRARRGRGGPANVLRAVPERRAGRCGEPPRHPCSARLVVTADRTWRGAQRCTFVAWTSGQR